MSRNKGKLRNVIIKKWLISCYSRLQPRKIWKYLLGLTCISCFLYQFPLMYATHYPYIEQDHVWGELAQITIENITLHEPVCKYDTVLNNTANMMSYIYKEFDWDGAYIKVGGEYLPQHCTPAFSVAIIVPYRQREVHLKKFLLYMHTFLRKQDIHYRIFVIEQDNMKPFNRAKLLNIGASYAIRAGFPCLILHDVDLLPFRMNNIYACTKLPRHMSSSISVFRFNLPYKTLFGGAVAILSKQFVVVNGMSNSYYGWGGEDDDFYTRIKHAGLSISRFEPQVGMYEMLTHISNVPNPSRNNLLNNADSRYSKDGLNSLNYEKKSTRLHPLFTHISVDI